MGANPVFLVLVFFVFVLVDRFVPLAFRHNYISPWGKCMSTRKTKNFETFFDFLFSLTLFFYVRSLSAAHPLFLGPFPRSPRPTHNARITRLCIMHQCATNAHNAPPYRPYARKKPSNPTGSTANPTATATVTVTATAIFNGDG